MKSQLRIAIIGCGGIARGHLNALKNLPAKVVALVDIDEARARQYAEEYGIPEKSIYFTNAEGQKINILTKSGELSSGKRVILVLSSVEVNSLNKS